MVPSRGLPFDRPAPATVHRCYAPRRRRPHVLALPGIRLEILQSPILLPTITPRPATKDWQRPPPPRSRLQPSHARWTNRRRARRRVGQRVCRRSLAKNHTTSSLLSRSSRRPNLPPPATPQHQHPAARRHAILGRRRDAKSVPQRREPRWHSTMRVSGNVASGKSILANSPNADDADERNTAAKSARRAHGAAIASGAWLQKKAVVRLATATAIIGMDITIIEAITTIDFGWEGKEEAFVIHFVSTHSRWRFQRSRDIRTTARRGSSYD